MEILDRITRYSQSAIKIETNGIIIWLDPYKLPDNEDKADYIFITHSHFDHLSFEDIEKIATDKTHFFAPYDCIPKLADAGYKKFTSVEPGTKDEIEDNILIETVPMYNINKTTYHPRGNKWVGYILTIEGKRIYHTGDTERIPEMKDVNCDIVFMPLGQTYTMDSVEDAAEAVLDVKAKIAIPFHYGLYEGKEEDTLKFRELLDGKVKVIIKRSYNVS